MVWMHNGRHRVRHFTRGKLCPSYDDIKEWHEDSCLLWFNRLFSVNYFSESKVLALQHM